jgi:hypothetical protein
LWTGLSDGGAVAFIAAAADSSATVGLYQADLHSTKKRAVVGDVLTDGAKLASFPLYPAVASSPRGALAFAIVGEAVGGESFEAILIARAPPE